MNTSSRVQAPLSRLCTGLLALSVSLLAACGGGEDPTSRSARASAAADRERAQAIAPPGGITTEDTWDAVVGWAGSAYPVQFPGTPVAVPVDGGRLYRFSNGNGISFVGSQIYLSGPVVGSATPTPFQTLDRFCREVPAACGVTLRRTAMWQGVEREYFVYVPWAARQSLVPVPAVMLIHGSNGFGRVSINTWGWKPVADREGVLLVAPSALNYCYLEEGDTPGLQFPADVSIGTKWASGTLGQATRPQCTGTQLDQLVQQGVMTSDQRRQVDHPVYDDVGALRELARLLPTDWSVDARRIYVSGFSNGGEMTFRLAAEASTTFAALASAAGVVLQSERTWPVTARPVSMIYSIGTLNLRGQQPLSTQTDIMASNPDLAERTAAFLAILGLSDAHRFLNLQVGGFDTGAYVYDTSTRPTPGGNVLYVGVMAGLPHEYPPTLPETLWNFFRTQVLP